MVKKLGGKKSSLAVSNVLLGSYVPRYTTQSQFDLSQGRQRGQLQAHRFQQQLPAPPNSFLLAHAVVVVPALAADSHQAAHGHQAHTQRHQHFSYYSQQRYCLSPAHASPASFGYYSQQQHRSLPSSSFQRREKASTAATWAATSLRRYASTGFERELE
jgi:hypothetical protein